MNIIRLIDLPTAVRAFTVPDVDGNYNVYINCNLSRRMQQQACQHELAHIEAGDIESEETAGLIECIRH